MAADKRAELSSISYTSEYLTPEGIKNVERVRHYYRAFQSWLTPSEAADYEKAFEVSYIQGTTNIEGNTFSSHQAFDLLIHNITPHGKSLREINEVQNFKSVILFRNKCKGKISLDFIRTLHQLIMNNIDMESAGTFRRIDNIGIVGCDLQVTPAVLIKPELEEQIQLYYQRLNKRQIHPFEAAVLFHYGFEMIHPFTDGNGRVGREIFNYMLRKCGYPRLLFLGSDRPAYIQSLKLGNQSKNADMIQLFVDLIWEQYYEKLVKKLKEVVTPMKKEQPTLDNWFRQINR
jgi:Fic family protein